MKTFLELYHEESRKQDIAPNDFYSALSYDCVWATALMLNASTHRLKQLNKSLETFSYEDQEMTMIFMDEMHALDYEGMSVSMLLFIFTNSTIWKLLYV